MRLRLALTFHSVFYTPYYVAHHRRLFDQEGLELVGPADRLRPLALPEKLTTFEPRPIVQQVAGGRLVFSLVRDPITEDVATVGKKGARKLAFFSVDPGSGKASALGEVPLGEDDEFLWAAGGNRIAVLRKAEGAATLQVYQR